MNHLKSIQRLPEVTHLEGFGSVPHPRSRWNRAAESNYCNIWKKHQNGGPSNEGKSCPLQVLRVFVEFLVGHGDMMLLVVEVDLKGYNEQQTKPTNAFIYIFELLSKNKQMLHFLGEEGMTMTGKKMARYQML